MMSGTNIATAIALNTSATSLWTIMVEGRSIKWLSLIEMERHHPGLCFNCNERYAHGHNKVCHHLFLLQDEEESDEAKTKESMISMHAIKGDDIDETMQVSQSSCNLLDNSLAKFGTSRGRAAGRGGEMF
ncbi:hypothetical protein GUJ93_ZPchr0015g6925 [Zizania palustris]|uniref:Uncharacterized protein n=1 Tax=Zizania palustris TaxID=103762 RepID=A0A8J5W131_ZIZPA|nr:hypothetical protein GUJ93_ZPchr0015g6925 [Zizania palustris]